MPIELPWLLPDGRAGGRADDGHTVRVTGAVPGDQVEIRRVGGTGRTIDAVVEQVVVPSPHRRAAPCPWSTSCGGCDLDVLEPDTQAELKARMVARAFRWDGEVPIVRGPAEGHRARIKLGIDGGRLGYRAARSHDLVPIEVCRVARPEIQQAHARLAAHFAEDPARARGLASVELRSDGQRVVLAFESSGAYDRSALTALAALDGAAGLGDVAVDGKRLAGDPTLWLEVEGVRLRTSAAAFFQVNPAVNARLVATAKEAVLSRGAERVLDLYAGIGNLGLPIAAAGTPVVAVEEPGPGAEDLRFNAGQVGRCEVIARKVEALDPSRIPFDAVVLDPPRAGARGVLAKVARNRPKVIVYVSCFAPNAARDLGELDRYALVSLTAFDLFPDTHHVEAVAVLERR